MKDVANMTNEELMMWALSYILMQQDRDGDYVVRELSKRLGAVKPNAPE